MIKRFLVVLILGLMVLPAPVFASSQSSLSVSGSPSSGTFNGSNNSFNIGFNLRNIPANADIVSASLSFSQSPSLSTDNQNFTVGNNGTVVAAGSFASPSAVNHSFSNLSEIVQGWLSSHNGNLVFNTSNLAEGNSVTFSNIQLSITYKIEDNSMPVISNIAVSSVTETSMKIMWRTNEATLGFVDYGLSTSYGLAVAGKNYIVDHAVTINGLKRDTTYNFRLHAKDSAGHVTISPNQTFKTSGESTEVPQNQTQQDNRIIGVEEEVLLPAEGVEFEIKENGDKFSVVLKWSKSRTESIDGYKIYKAINERYPEEIMTEVDANTFSFEDSDVEKEVQYFYIVRSFKADDESVDSNIAVVKVDEDRKITLLLQNIKGPSFWVNLAGMNLITIGVLAIVYLFGKIVFQLRNVLKRKRIIKSDIKVAPEL